MLGASDGIDLARLQVHRRELGAIFDETTNTVTAVYGKRAEQARNLAWEETHGATRMTTAPNGFEGDVWA